MLRPMLIPDSPQGPPLLGCTASAGMATKPFGPPGDAAGFNGAEATNDLQFPVSSSTSSIVSIGQRQPSSETRYSPMVEHIVVFAGKVVPICMPQRKSGQREAVVTR